MARVDLDSGAPHAVLSGGGSGGHVFPGLAVADELVRRGWRVSWVGSTRALDARLVEQRRVPFHGLPARPLVGRGWAAKVQALVTLAASSWRARAVLRRLGARVVVGTGGYVSAPSVVAGRLASRPVLLLEPNAEAGFANRWLSRLAAEAAVAFDEAAATLHCPAHTTGVPIRDEFFAIPAALPPAPPWRLLVLGGSQGAQQLNQALPRALSRAAAKLDGALAVLHQAGERHLESTREAYRQAIDAAASGGPAVTVEVTPFLDGVAAAMAESHLLVSRAGAITLAEICAAGRPSLLVPLALAGGHQLTNAQRLEARGAAEVLPPDAGAEDLAVVVTRLLSDRAGLEAMARSARKLSRPNAASAIADRVEHLGGAR
ncbi:MAG: undecaprenyldiphospho-muramoylpentapeptide beta-N-acetylglucosaminyltransferase [Thermoanaerobaculia bacterium]